MPSRLAFRSFLVTGLFLTVFNPVITATAETQPSLRHGLGQVLAGVVLELPKTVLDATLSNPPVVGTAIGLLAGTIGAIQKTLSGLVEIARAFKPGDW